MRPERDNNARTVELHSTAERGWWLRTRRPDDTVSVMFIAESAASDVGAAELPLRGLFRGLVAAQEGRMTAVQVFLDGVIGGHIVDLDTADGESRVIHPVCHRLEGALGTVHAGYFVVAPIQLAGDEDDA